MERQRHGQRSYRRRGQAGQGRHQGSDWQGKTLGDANLAADGKSDKVEGKIQNAIGGLMDALKK
jgi:hypothetical protein